MDAFLAKERVFASLQPTETSFGSFFLKKFGPSSMVITAKLLVDYHMRHSEI